MIKDELDKLYDRYNKRSFVSPDPLQFLYRYDDAGDREVVALIASSLAYGRVAQILVSVERVLDRMGPHPRQFLLASDDRSLSTAFTDFKHRFADGGHLTALLTGARRVIERFGSLQEAFAAGPDGDGQTVIQALSMFLKKLRDASDNACGHLLPSHDSTSACKRMHLFLRWMVRRDEVDPGGWEGVSPARLVVPLDTHMFRVGTELGFTRRRQADARSALEITAAFRDISPDDPVRYDFCLTRLGIRGDLNLDSFLASCRDKRICHGA